ncbi:lipopolysaccharide biosynthesis protein [Hafnia alvei]|uniref:Uncharacterized protein n=1 Tax=Hafnia alvei TaxID=569 RepID=A0A172WZV8_HAFAL|nr:hypothetical protein [Hafnia alvei]ANF29904.1 hypothetical protein [Hafnia alvei]TBL83574.1 hypothetical protein EYY88_16890 [Hafnia alvei]
MRSKKTLKNIKVDLVITLLIVLLGFVSRKVFIEYMGSNFTGLMLLFVQLIGMINIAEMGVGTATASLLYKPLSQNKHDVVSNILTSAAKVYNYISLLVFIIGIATGVIVYFSVASVSVIQYAPLYWLMYVLNTALSYRFAHYLILLTADQKYHSTRIIQGGAKVACISIQLVMICLFKNFFIYILCESIFLLIQLWFFSQKVKNEYPYIRTNASSVHNEFQQVKDKIKNVFFHKLGGVLVFNTDYLIISKFLNLSAVTIYSSYMMIFQALVMVVNILGNSVTASVGNFLSQKDLKEKKQLWDQIIILFFYFATCITLVTLLTITDFIRLWIGNDYVLDQLTLYVLAFNLFVLISRISLDILKNASGEFGDIYLPIFEGVVNIIASIYLVNKIGFLGVIVGTAISNILIICLAKPLYLFRKVLNGSFSGFILSIITPVSLAFVSIIIIFSLKNVATKNSDFYHWAIDAGQTSVIVFFTVTIIFLFSNDFRLVLRRLISALSKSKK